MDVITYQHIQAEPFQVKEVLEMKITKSPNEHSRLKLYGVLEEDLMDNYAVEATASKTVKIKVTPGEGEAKVIFSGVIEKLEINANSNVFYINIEAVSHSIKLDIERVRRSYQNKQMTYDTLMNKSIEAYGGDIMDKLTKGQRTGNFILQYDETSWDFVKRMASRFKGPIIVEDILDEPKVYAGLPMKREIGRLEDFNYTISKRTQNYRVSKEDFKDSVMEASYIYYKILSDQVFELAERVSFKGRILYVMEADIAIENGVLKNSYILSDESGFHQNTRKNQQIIGLSLEGKVRSVGEDLVQIDLDIDIPYGQEDYCWFKYVTPYTSENLGGFYCMPELNERVRLYLPDYDEEHAVSAHCIRNCCPTGEERGDPDIKYWRSYSGKEIMFTPNGVKIRCLDDEIFLYMIEEEGILMQSNKPIQVIANEGAGIDIAAEGKVIIAAEEEIEIFCNGSRINMKDGITKIRGNSIYEN